MSFNNYPSDILVLGIGNPILGDDGIGIQIGHSISKELGLDFREGTSIGFELLQIIEGIKCLVICDAIKVTDNNDIGKIFQFTTADFKNAFHLTSPHTFNLATGLEFAKKMSLDMPEIIEIYGIGILTPTFFSESLSPVIIEKYDSLVAGISKIIRNKNWYNKKIKRVLNLN